MIEMYDTDSPLVRERSSVRITPAAPLKTAETRGFPVRGEDHTRQLITEHVRNTPTSMGESPTSARSAVRVLSDPQSFFRRLDIRAGGCWQWTTAKDRYGYGVVQWDGRLQRAHRVAYALANGQAPGHVLHSCDNPACCNPGHLRSGTHAENMRDMVQRGRHGSKKYSDSLIRSIRERHAAGESQRAIARDTGVSRSHVGKICRGEKRQLNPPAQSSGRETPHPNTEGD